MLFAGPRGFSLRLACSWEREQCGSNEGCIGSTIGGAVNSLQEREGRDAVGSGH